MYKIKLTTNDGVIYPTDLQNLSKLEAKNKLDLLATKTLNDIFSIEWQGWDVVCLNYVDGEFELYEIIEQY